MSNKFKSRPYKPKAQAKTKVDKRQDKVISRIVKQFKPEQKYQDLTAGAVSPSWNGVAYSAIVVGQGTSDKNRIGDQITITRIRFRWNVGYTSASLASNQFRMVIYRDKTATIGTTVTNVLDNNLVATVNACQAPYEEDKRMNFEILYDKTVLLDTVSRFAAQGSYDHTFKTPKLMQYDAGTNTPNKGAIYIMFITDALAPALGTDWNSRIWYTDM